MLDQSENPATPTCCQFALGADIAAEPIRRGIEIDAFNQRSVAGTLDMIGMPGAVVDPRERGWTTARLLARIALTESRTRVRLLAHIRFHPRGGVNAIGRRRASGSRLVEHLDGELAGRIATHHLGDQRLRYVGLAQQR